MLVHDPPPLGGRQHGVGVARLKLARERIGVGGLAECHPACSSEGHIDLAEREGGSLAALALPVDHATQAQAVAAPGQVV